MSVAVPNDVMINPPPASAVTSTTSVVEASTPASAASSVSTVDNNPSVCDRIRLHGNHIRFPNT